MAKGASIYDVRKIFGILDPLPSLVRIWNWSTLLNSRNLPYYIFFWANPPSPYQCGRHTWMPPKANLWMDHLHLSELRNLVSRHSCTLLGVQSWERFYQQEFGEFPWPAWTVGSYSSGSPALEHPKSKLNLPRFASRCVTLYKSSTFGSGTRSVQETWMFEQLCIPAILSPFNGPSWTTLFEHLESEHLHAGLHSKTGNDDPSFKKNPLTSSKLLPKLRSRQAHASLL